MTRCNRACRLFVAFALLGPAFAHGENVAGFVTGVNDGDTLTILTDGRQYKIRLSGIDAPERTQPFGEKSRAFLGALAFNKEATAACHKTDRYGREVCVVTVGGVDIGLEQIKAGLAWWYRDYAKEQTPEDRTNYEAAEFQSKAHRAGLWADAKPIPPWEWRRKGRKAD